MTLFGCSKSFVVKNKKKDITLNQIEYNNPKISFENNLVIARFNVSDLINCYEKSLSEFESREIKEEIVKLKSIENDTILDYEVNKNFVKFQEYNYYFHQLILDKKAEIIKKSDNQKLNKVKYHFMEDRLGGQQAVFYFEDGTEFYRVILRLGE